MLTENDGALIIGDPGMTFSREGYHVWDLATLWRQHTGLGFVFAMWMIRDDAANAARSLDFEHARDEGLASLNEIVDYYEKLLQLSRTDIVNYLTDNISFTPDETMQQGMGLYFELAYKHGLIEAVKPLRFSAGIRFENIRSPQDCTSLCPERGRNGSHDQPDRKLTTS